MNRRVAAEILCLVLIVLMMIAPVSAMAETKVQIMNINVEGARLREGPGDYNISCSLKKGTKVFYTGKRVNAFCKVYLTNGRVGFVYKDFLTKLATVDMDQIYYTVAKVPLYKLPSDKSDKVCTAKYHSFVVVYEVEGDWALVRTLSGKTGFAKFADLEPLA